MLVIEMHMSNVGKDSYIWALGQSWPVPQDEDFHIMRIEAFGGEFCVIDPKFFKCNPDCPDPLFFVDYEKQLAEWKLDSAKELSAHMRKWCGQTPKRAR